MTNAAPRDFVGYGDRRPPARWPNGARIAVQFVLNYEEGGERHVDDGDATSEVFLSEVLGAAPYPARHMSVESSFEYGSRAGAWRVLDSFSERGLPLTVFAVAQALARNQPLADRVVADGHEVAGHGYKWISYQEVEEGIERRQLRDAVETLSRVTGTAPTGWYTGRDSPNTRRLVVEHGGFLYDSDSYADDLPYYVVVSGHPHLVVPYTLDVNDMRFLAGIGFGTGRDFLAYCQDAFDVLYREGAARPAMLSVGLHGRIIGRPGRCGALEAFLGYIGDHEDVWVCRRVDIARHWLQAHPAYNCSP